MLRVKRNLLLLCCLQLALVSGPVAAETLKQAVDAFDFQEYDNARKWLLPWAKKGEPDAQYRLGIMYEEGLGVPADPDRARDWYQRAAKGGHAGARKRLKKMRRSAVSADGRKSVALDWYREKAAEGDVEAQYQLGFIYETGLGTAKDEVRAARWYEEAASNEHVQAQLRLGLMYLNGAGVAESRIQGSRWLRQAAASKDRLARKMLDKVVGASANLELDVTAIAARVRVLSQKDTASASAWIDRQLATARSRVKKREAKREKALARSRRIESTAEKTFRDMDPGFGLDARGERTLAWYQRQAELGNVDAQFELARRYHGGDGTGIDPQQAMGWFITAAEQGHGGAQYYLAMFHYYGIGVEASQGLAREWLQRAVASGHEEAAAEAARISAESAGRRQQSMAVWWLRQYGADDPVAHFYLGRMYEQGRGVAADQKLADQWYASSTSDRVQSARDKKLQRIREASLRQQQALKPVAVSTPVPAPASVSNPVSAPASVPVPADDTRTVAVATDTGQPATPPPAPVAAEPDWLAEYLQLDKIRNNWLLLAMFTLVLLALPFFIEQRRPDSDSPF